MVKISSRSVFKRQINLLKFQTFVSIDWRGLTRATQPDTIVFSHSPGLMLLRPDVLTADQRFFHLSNKRFNTFVYVTSCMWRHSHCYLA